MRAATLGDASQPAVVSGLTVLARCHWRVVDLKAVLTCCFQGEFIELALARAWYPARSSSNVRRSVICWAISWSRRA